MSFVVTSSRDCPVRTVAKTGFCCPGMFIRETVQPPRSLNVRLKGSQVSATLVKWLSRVAVPSRHRFHRPGEKTDRLPV